MTDPTFFVNLESIYDVLKGIRDDLPSRTPVVVSVIVPTLEMNIPEFMCMGVEHKALALAVWSTGQVTPIYRVPGRGHIRTVEPYDTWHFKISENETEPIPENW